MGAPAFRRAWSVDGLAKGRLTSLGRWGIANGELSHGQPSPPPALASRRLSRGGSSNEIWAWARSRRFFLPRSYHTGPRLRAAEPAVLVGSRGNVVGLNGRGAQR